MCRNNRSHAINTKYKDTLFFIGIYAAMMSRMNSLINTGAMTIVLDFCPAVVNKGINNSRVVTLGVTILAVYTAIKIQSMPIISWHVLNIITTWIFVP